MVRICKVHNIEYDYVCKECVQPFLINTKFKDLKEIREYQKQNAKKIEILDKKADFELIGIIKTKIVKEFAYSGIAFYNLQKRIIHSISFKSFRPKFTEYFPSILFLNQTEVYLDFINDLELLPECFIINSSGQIHPYLYGLACDLGLKIAIPVIGYTKKLLFGEIKEIDSSSDILGVFNNKSLIGYAIPKPNSKKYLYISVGNNITLKTALNVFINTEIALFNKISTELNEYVQSFLQ